MKTEERNAIIGKRVNEWFEKHPQPRICDLVISIIEELETSRDSRILSAVPSEERIEEMAVEFVDTIEDKLVGDILISEKSGIVKHAKYLIHAVITETKRGIAG